MKNNGKMTKILVVHKNRPAFGDLMTAVGGLGFAVIKAESLKQVLRQLEIHPEVRLVISAREFVNGSGPDLVMILRSNRRFRNMPILLACSDWTQQDVIHCAGLNLVQLINLPCPEELLKAKIEQLMTAGRPRVLVVDDEEIIAQSLKDFLEMRDYDVLTADSGYKALDLLNNSKADIIITDVRMPGMTGEDLLTAVKNRFPHIPVLLMTGYSNMNAQEAQKSGAAAFISKPFRYEELSRLIDSTLDKYKATNNTPGPTP
nr:response regulator [candidate division Zixibacteria bacterium]